MYDQFSDRHWQLKPPRSGASGIEIQHAVFHLLPGLLGIAVASRPRAALAYALGVGTVYIVAGTWGLLAGGTSLGVIAVDSPGDVVHISEGVIALTAGVLTLRHRRAVAEGIQAS